ncbi:polysaccharide biosynthesis protein, partial [bacterium]|nr:polysaccharide biosynthesis protein [bacterium]
NIMGASKSLMEKILLSEMNSINIKTARFANVAFSNGSLLDGFINRINKKQPISCPNDIKRFFVSPEESGQICMLATYLGDSGNIFFPKFNFENDQIFFEHIARKFFNYLGYTLHECKSENEAKKFDFYNNKKKYPIFFFKSDTSGEKEYEEFYTERESVDLKTFDSLGFIKKDSVKLNTDQVKLDFEKLFTKTSISKSDIVDLIKSYVPDFNHIEKGKSLDEKM